MVEILNCPQEGGIVLMEPDRLKALMKLDFIEEGWDPPSAFSVALDFEGKTDQVPDWEDDEGDWSVVWRRACAPLVDLVNRGEMALLILSDGRFLVDADLDAPRPNRAGLREFQSRLEIVGGTLAIAEIGALVTSAPMPKAPDPTLLRYREIAVPPGSYRVRFFLLPTAEASPFGRYSLTFGTPDDPAVYVRMERSDTPAPPIEELFHHEMNHDQP